MFFSKKEKKISCESCNSKVDKKFNYCPSCGSPLFDKEKETRDFGMLGKNDSIREELQSVEGFGITDKIIGSLVNSLMKNIDKQFKEMEKESGRPNIAALPNGIKISIGSPVRENKAPKKSIKQVQLTEKQIEKISKLPKEEAKTNIKRLSDKLVYELKTPGVSSIKDVFISKLEKGYEIKALGEETVYVNSLPVELPLESIGLGQDFLVIEFKNNFN